MTSVEKVTAFLAEPRNVIVGGTRKDGRAHLSPNWFYWDGEHFYISTTRHRVKYPIFKRDPRVQLLVDDSTGHRAVFISGTVEIREDLSAELPRFRAIRAKHGITDDGDAAYLKSLEDEGRVMLVITPDLAPADWTSIDLD
jgi:PPOX class probable F420-dependent enzyme